MNECLPSSSTMQSKEIPKGYEVQVKQALKEASSREDLFFSLLDQQILSDLVVYTNQKRELINRSKVLEKAISPITFQEITVFLGCRLVMSLVHAPTTRWYWWGPMRFDKIANSFVRDRFEEIARCLKFCCEETHFNEDDSLYKIR